jgi:hypothetical protein
MRFSNKVKPEILINIAVLLVLIFQIVTSEQGGGRSHIVVNKNDSLSDEELKRIVCRDGMTSILRREPDDDLVPRELISALEKDDYDEIGREVSESSRAEIKGNQICQYIIKDRRGLRSFDVELYVNNEFPMKYKIYGFNEVGTRKGDL